MAEEKTIPLESSVQRTAGDPTPASYNGRLTSLVPLYWLSAVCRFCLQVLFALFVMFVFFLHVSGLPFVPRRTLNLRLLYEAPRI